MELTRSTLLTFPLVLFKLVKTQKQYKSSAIMVHSHVREHYAVIKMGCRDKFNDTKFIKYKEIKMSL